jgi:hypothetical protein
MKVWDESRVVHDATLARRPSFKLLRTEYCTIDEQRRSILRPSINRPHSSTVETHEYIQIFVHSAGAKVRKVRRDLCELNVLGLLYTGFSTNSIVDIYRVAT